MRKTRCLVALAAWILLMNIGFAGGVHAAEKPVFLAFSGGPSSGVFGKAGAGVAVVLQNLSKGRLSVTAQASSGGQENLVIVNSGKAEMGASSGPDIHDAFYGKGAWKDKKQENLRVIGILMNSVANVVALEGSGIKTMEDLKGKKVSYGSSGSSSAGLSEKLFEHLGINVTKSFLAGGPAASALKDGHIDGYLWAPSMPAPDVIDLSSTSKIRILDAGTPAEKSGFFKAHPYYAPFTIPAGTYKGVDQDVPSIATGIYWIVNKDVPDELVYEMTKLAYENTEACKTAFGPLKEMQPKLESIKYIDIPLHAGAQKFWQEKGVSIADIQKAK